MLNDEVSAWRQLSLNDTSFLQKDADSTEKGHFTLEADPAPADSPSEYVAFCSESSTDGEEIDSEDEEDHWVPHDDDFEAKVIQATENDYELSAQLIPQLHKIFHQEHSSIVGAWKACHRQCASESSGHSGGATGESISNFNGSENNNRKKRKAENSDDEAGDDQQDDRSGKNYPDSHNAGKNVSPKLALACPLQKKYPKVFNPSYRPQDERKGKYSSCTSGFESIARLLEHINRTHRHIQCSKCSRRFPGTVEERKDKFLAHNELEDCPRVPPTIIEGVTEWQWRQLEKLTKGRQAKGKGKALGPNVERWNMIWRVLFPDENLPTPWCVPVGERGVTVSSVDQEAEEYAGCYDSLAMDRTYGSEKEKSIAAFKAYLIKKRISQGEIQRPSPVALDNNEVLNAKPPQLLNTNTSSTASTGLGMYDQTRNPTLAQRTAYAPPLPSIPLSSSINPQFTFLQPSLQGTHDLGNYQNSTPYHPTQQLPDGLVLTENDWVEIQSNPRTLMINQNAANQARSNSQSQIHQDFPYITSNTQNYIPTEPQYNGSLANSNYAQQIPNQDIDPNTLLYPQNPPDGFAPNNPQSYMESL